MIQLLNSTLYFLSLTNISALLNAFMIMAFIGLFMGMFCCFAHALDYPFYRRKLQRDWGTFQDLKEPLWRKDAFLWQRLSCKKISNPFAHALIQYFDSKGEFYNPSILESIGLIKRLRQFETMNSLLPLSGLLGTLVGLAGVLQCDDMQIGARNMYFAQMLLTTIVSLLGQGIGTLFVTRNYEHLGFHYQQLWSELLAEFKEMCKEMSSTKTLDTHNFFESMRINHE